MSQEREEEEVKVTKLEAGNVAQLAECFPGKLRPWFHLECYKNGAWGARLPKHSREKGRM